MLRHPYTLVHCAKSFQRLLNGSTIVECYIKDDDTLTLCCAGDDVDYDVECSLLEPMLGVFVRRRQGRPHRNTRDVFSLALNARIQTVVTPTNDRVLCIVCHRVKFYIQLFSGGASNIVLTNSDDVVVDALRNKAALYNHEYTVRPLSLPNLTDLQDDFLHRALARSGYQLGPAYAREVCFRAGVDANLKVGNLLPEQRESVLRSADELREQCLSAPRFQLRRDEQGREILSLTSLHLYPVLEAEYDDINEALMWRTIHLYRERRYLTQIAALRTRIQRERRRCESAISQMEDHLKNDERAQQFKYFADYLLSQSDVHSKGKDSIEGEGWYGERLHIPLEPTLNMAENAQRYYDKVRRSREAMRVSAQRLPQYQKKLAELARIDERLNQEPSVDELNSWAQQLGIKDGRQSLRNNNQSMESPDNKYRVFRLDEGFTLYVGRNSQNNDELTMRFAKQNDIWMHARGVSGSHAVLRSPDTTKVPKQILEKAAAIAAYYSKARNAKYTPVVYTQRKYVRKPKGAAVGAVTLEREDVIMVEPKLPEGQQED